MGGKGGGGLSQSYQDAMAANSTALTQLAQQQGANSQKLFQESNPGFESAESFYNALSSGDPYAISRATAPATEQISQATDSAKKNILESAPAGGEKNLALEQADVSRGSEVGKVESGAFTGSFNALASLAGQGTKEGIASAGAATSAYGASNQGWNNIGQLQIEQKGQTLGAISSLGGDAATVGAAAIKSSNVPAPQLNDVQAADLSQSDATKISTAQTPSQAGLPNMSPDSFTPGPSNQDTSSSPKSSFGADFAAAFPGLSWDS